MVALALCIAHLGRDWGAVGRAFQILAVALAVESVLGGRRLRHASVVRAGGLRGVWTTN